MEFEQICGWQRVKVPECCIGESIVIGIDEAGRGPVLGSLIYVAAFWPTSENEAISRLGFDDSKVLTEVDRERLFRQMLIHPSIGWVIQELSAPKISEEMLRPHPVSLNAMSYDAVVKALETIRDVEPVPPCPSNIYIDTVGDPEYYKSWLVRALGENYGQFTIEKKADATYKIVSAASIIAKVTRDTLLKQWQWTDPHITIDKGFGSGYPSDDICVKWLERSVEKVFGYPSVVRFSWSTCRDMMIKRKCVDVKWECDDEEDAGGADIKNYFGAVGSKRPKRAAYFNKLKLKQILLEDIPGHLT